MADESSAVARLEAEVAALLQQIPTAAGNNEQLELLRRAQEIALHRDASGDAHRLLHAALPFLQTLLHQQNAPLVAAILTFLAEASRRSRLFFRDLFDAVATVLLLSYSSEKNVLKALDLATASLLDAFQFVATPASTSASASAGAPSQEQLAELWSRVSVAIDHVAELALASPINLLPATPSDNNNRSAAVFLRAWKLLERAVLVLTDAQGATVYRDPARSNVQPDAVTVDLLPASVSPVSRDQLVDHGDALLRRLIDRVLTPADGVAPLTRRELCVALNSLSLIAALRPQLLSVVIPALIACQSVDSVGTSDRAVQATIKANLVKLLSHPAAQELAEEVTECVIALGDGERAFRAISKSKDPRRKYVTAPSEASLRRARIGKRTAEQISEAADHKPSVKRPRGDVSATAPTSPDRITPEVLVNMPSSEVLNLVLSGFESELPAPPPRNLALLLPPTELKARMTSLLARVATPSSVLALETSIRRSRDPRRRRESQGSSAHQQPSLVPVFDEETVDEVGDWMSKNSTTVEEPLVSLAEDNSVQVFLKPVSAVWCRDMAAAALSRILENEYGGSIRGDDTLRESLLCRLASSPWFLLTDDRNSVLTIKPSLDDAKLPPVYQTILDFVLEDIERRASLASELLHHEYVRVTTEMVQDSVRSEADALAGPPKTGDVIYRKAVNYFLSALLGRLDLSSSSEKKLFGGIVTQLPRVTVDVLRVATSLFTDPHKSSGGAVLGITVLRDLIRDRKACEDAALRVLLRYTCDSDETCRNSSIRCVANQLYVLDGLKKPIEQYAIQLVTSLEEGSTSSSAKTSSGNDQEDTAMEDSDAGPVATEEEESTVIEGASESSALRSPWLRERLAKIQDANHSQAAELQEFAQALDQSASNLSNALDTEIEILRRLELYLALCAKKPSLLGHLITTYGRASELARQVIFQAIEKLIKHLKQRSNGNNQVVAQLQGFEAPALGLVCHVIQILATRSTSTSSTRSAADEANANAELVTQILALWQSHTHIPDGISVLIPVVSSIPKDTLLPLLPALLSLPQNRWSVAITRVLEAMPPQVLTPIDLLIALHHVDLKADAGMQKKVILAINFCMENRHAFPAEVLLHVCRVLLQEEHISKLALRTLILSVTTHPALQQDAAQLLRGLVDRCVWEMQDEGDALWKGFVKCAALIQPASFPVLLDSNKFPVAQLQLVLQEEPTLRGLMREFVASSEAEGSGLQISDDVRELLVEGADTVEAAATESTDETEPKTSQDGAADGEADDASAPMDVDEDTPTLEDA